MPSQTIVVPAGECHEISLDVTEKDTQLGIRPGIRKAQVFDTDLQAAVGEVSDTNTLELCEGNYEVTWADDSCFEAEVLSKVSSTPPSGGEPTPVDVVAPVELTPDCAKAGAVTVCNTDDITGPIIDALSDQTSAIETALTTQTDTLVTVVETATTDITEAIETATTEITTQLEAIDESVTEGNTTLTNMLTELETQTTALETLNTSVVEGNVKLGDISNTLDTISTTVGDILTALNDGITVNVDLSPVVDAVTDLQASLEVLLTLTNDKLDTANTTLTSLLDETITGNVTLVEIRDAIAAQLPILTAIDENTDDVEPLLTDILAAINAIVDLDDTDDDYQTNVVGWPVVGCVDGQPVYGIEKIISKTDPDGTILETSEFLYMTVYGDASTITSTKPTGFGPCEVEEEPETLYCESTLADDGSSYVVAGVTYPTYQDMLDGINGTEVVAGTDPEFTTTEAAPVDLGAGSPTVTNAGNPGNVGDSAYYASVGTTAAGDNINLRITVVSTTNTNMNVVLTGDTTNNQYYPIRLSNGQDVDSISVRYDYLDDAGNPLTTEASFEFRDIDGALSTGDQHLVFEPNSVDAYELTPTTGLTVVENASGLTVTSSQGSIPSNDDISIKTYMSESDGFTVEVGSVRGQTGLAMGGVTFAGGTTTVVKEGTDPTIEFPSQVDVTEITYTDVNGDPATASVVCKTCCAKQIELLRGGTSSTPSTEAARYQGTPLGSVCVSVDGGGPEYGYPVPIFDMVSGTFGTTVTWLDELGNVIAGDVVKLSEKECLNCDEGSEPEPTMIDPATTIEFADSGFIQLVDGDNVAQDMLTQAYNDYAQADSTSNFQITVSQGNILDEDGNPVTLPISFPMTFNTDAGDEDFGAGAWGFSSPDLPLQVGTQIGIPAAGSTMEAITITPYP